MCKRKRNITQYIKTLDTSKFIAKLKINNYSKINIRWKMIHFRPDINQVKGGGGVENHSRKLKSS